MTRVYLLIVFALSFCASLGAQDKSQLTADEKAAVRAIQARAKALSGMAYVTVTFTDLEVDEITRDANGNFSIRCTFGGSWGQTDGYFTQLFRFDKSGKCLGVSNKAKSWFLAPYDEYELAREVIKELLKKDLEKDPQLKKAVQSASGRDVAVALLNHVTGHVE